MTCSQLKVTQGKLFDGSSLPLVLRSEQGVLRFELLAAPGSCLTFTFDNAYSRFTAKTVLFGAKPV